MACTPEGFIMDAFEFMGAESCSQRYLFLARLKQCYPVLNVVLHDDACHLRRFADARAALSFLAHSLSFPQMRYILDRFHAKGHVDPWCLEHVHPENDGNKQLIEGKNSSRCEILFTWLKNYKHMFRTMGRWTGNFFVQEMLEMHNEENVYNARAYVEPPPSACSDTSSSSSSSSSCEH